MGLEFSNLFQMKNLELKCFSDLSPCLTETASEAGNDVKLWSALDDARPAKVCHTCTCSCKSSCSCVVEPSHRNDDAFASITVTIRNSCTQETTLAAIYRANCVQIFATNFQGTSRTGSYLPTGTRLSVNSYNHTICPFPSDQVLLIILLFNKLKQKHMETDPFLLLLHICGTLFQNI